ncbi:MAG: transcriptional coactivator p15/PC4 family protein [Candidatus Omnitrophota bacterium]
METQNTAQDAEQEIVVLADIPRSKNDIYRISQKNYKGNRYLDLRIFFRAKDGKAMFLPSGKGVCFAEKFREAIIAGLIKARTAPQAVRTEGVSVASVTVCDIPASETEIFRISKGCGQRATFVDIRKFYSKDGTYFPSKRKGVSIPESVLEDVILGLMPSSPARAV